MFGSSSSRGANAYAVVGIESKINSASPNALVIMLYDGAIGAINMAILHMRENKVLEKSKSISHAIQIIDSGLRAAINKRAGGAIAESLDSLYIYMSSRLLMASLRKETESLEEVRGLLSDLKQGWIALEYKQNGVTHLPVAAPAKSSAAMYGGMARMA